MTVKFTARLPYMITPEQLVSRKRFDKIDPTKRRIDKVKRFSHVQSKYIDEARFVEILPTIVNPAIAAVIKKLKKYKVKFTEDHFMNYDGVQICIIKSVVE